ncbi:MAG: pyridoxamine 5'-phosphate oxidase family protein [Bacteroides sp.]|nr:pyridoxamine 5'-phosphate oxidase family protein [Bacteroides sp.]
MEGLKKQILSILSANMCAALSTVSKSGQLHSNTIYYCYDKDLNLYFASDCGTLHAQNILHNCNVAICIWNNPISYGKEHIGIQIDGRCQEVGGRNLIRAWGGYMKRFPIFQEKTNPEYLLKKIVNIRLFKVWPEQIQLTNSIIYGTQIKYYTNELL